MYPEVVKYRLWQLALRMNPQTAVYGVRTSATEANGTDTFQQYNLMRLVYRELTAAEAAMAGLTLADVYRVWTIFTPDLDQSGAPIPQLSYTLAFADGTSWIIEKITKTGMNQAFECLCRLAR